MTAADKPPTEPGLANYKVPKGRVKVLPDAVPGTVPAGVMVEFNSFEHFVRLPGAFSALRATISMPAAFAQSPAYGIGPNLTAESAPTQLVQIVLVPCGFHGFGYPEHLPFGSNFIVEVQQLVG